VGFEPQLLHWAESACQLSLYNKRYSSVLFSDSKCGFSRDLKKSLKRDNRVSYRSEKAVRPTQIPFQCGRFVADRPHFESLLQLKAMAIPSFNWIAFQDKDHMLMMIMALVISYIKTLAFWLNSKYILMYECVWAYCRVRCPPLATCKQLGNISLV